MPLESPAIRRADPIRARFHLAAAVLSALVAVAGVAAFSGWWFEQMPAGTALGLALTGAALWCYQLPDAAPWRNHAATALAGASAVVALSAALDLLTGWPLGIERLVGLGAEGNAAVPARMSLSTAASFVLLDAAILVGVLARRIGVSQVLATAALFVSATSAAALLFKAEVAPQFMALTSTTGPSACALLLLCLGVLFARPAAGCMTVVSDSGPAGFVARRLLPPVIALPLLLAWLSWRGEVREWYDSAFAMAIFAASSATGLTVVVGLSGTMLQGVERRRAAAERQRLESEDRLRHAVSEAPVPMVIHDEAGRILHMSQGWTDYSGYSIEDTPTIPAWIARAQASAKSEVEAYVRKLFHATGTLRGREENVTTRSGDVRQWEFSTTPLAGGEGMGRTFLTMAVDVTERRRAEAELRRTNESLEHRILERTQELTRVNDALTHVNDALKRQSDQLREQAALLDISRDGILVRDLFGTIVYWSAGATRLFGHTREEALGGVSHRLLDSIFPQPLTEIEQHVLLHGDWEGEVIQTRRDGTKIAVESRWTLTRTEAGAPDGFLQIDRDISARKRAEESLRESELRFRAVAETANAGVVTLDQHGVVHYWNPWCSQIFGISEREAEGRPLTAMLPERLHKELLDGITRPPGASQAPLVGRTVEWSGRRPDGTEFPLEMSLSSWETSRGVFFSAILRDITERKRAQRALELKADELARSNQELEQFAYVASHDLQEPLRMVSNYTQLLARRYKDQLDADANEFIEYAVDGAKRMQALIHDLLQLARVGTRGKEFRAAPVERVVQDALANLSSAVEESNARVDVGPMPTVICDASQLAQVFQNLIGNALKFRQPQRPTVVTVAAERQPDGWVFQVRDNGIGIEPKYFERIFQMFQRLHGRGEYAGTGIGLALCKKIVERHGGHISVASEPGLSTTFSFTIPDVAVAQPVGARS